MSGATVSKQPRAQEYTHNGETHTIYGWANKLNLSPQMLGRRIKKWGWERAITTPKREFKYKEQQHVRDQRTQRQRRLHARDASSGG